MVSPNARIEIRLPLLMAPSHHSAPRRLISLSNSGPGMMPWYAVRHAKSWVAASGTASDDLARRISMTTVCMGGIEPTWPLPFKSNVNIRLTVRLSWEVCQNQLPPWAQSYAGAERGGFATPVLQVRRKRRRGEVRAGGMGQEQDTGNHRPGGEPLITPLRLPCAVRRACVHGDRAIVCASGSILGSPRPIRRLGYRRAPSRWSFGSAGSGAPPRPSRSCGYW